MGRHELVRHVAVGLSEDMVLHGPSPLFNTPSARLQSLNSAHADTGTNGPQNVAGKTILHTTWPGSLEFFEQQVNQFQRNVLSRPEERLWAI